MPPIIDVVLGVNVYVRNVNLGKRKKKRKNERKKTGG